MCGIRHSTGLDSSTSYDILAALREWCDTTGGTVIATLLQPIPEVYNMFDQGAVHLILEPPWSHRV